MEAKKYRERNGNVEGLNLLYMIRKKPM